MNISGQYIRYNSLIHKLDPRLKMLAIIILIIAVFIIPAAAWMQFTAFYLFLLLIIILSQVKISLIIKNLTLFIAFLLLTFVIQLLLYPGEEIFRLGIISISKEATIVSCSLFARLLYLFILAELFAMTTAPLEFTGAVEKLLLPLSKFRVPARELALMMTVALRFIPWLVEECEKVCQAQIIRGAPIKHGRPGQRILCLKAIVIPVVSGAFRKADELAVAMEARCYDDQVQRSRAKELHFKKCDWLALLILLLFVVLVRFI